ncbi:MAG: 3-deoxy-manno-octulosonate cytidylyltransferase [Candidatus Omnitrophota bacterium]
MKTVGIIPARYQSTRFPGKPLVSLLGKPMVIWVAQVTAKALGRDNTFVATDDQRIAKIVVDFGFQLVMTSDKALTGTDRVWEAAQKIEADTYINVQGDEPTLCPEDILTVLKCKKRYPQEVVNGMCKLRNNDDPKNTNFPKVITTEDLRMVYMSRLPIPGVKSQEKAPKSFWRQVCIYAFNREQLKLFGEFGHKSYLESFEDIEMLRFFELGIFIRMVVVEGSLYAVDAPEDVKVVENVLRKKYDLK